MAMLDPWDHDRVLWIFFATGAGAVIAGLTGLMPVWGGALVGLILGIGGAVANRLGR